jgi:short-subunit dehydrogenase
VRVTVLCPGPVPTEFGARAGISASMAPAILTLSAERVAEAGYRGLMQGRRTVVPGLSNKLIVLLLRLIPRSLVLTLVDARQRRRRPAPRT